MKVQSTFYIDFISKTVDVLLISSFITKQMPKLLIFDAFTLLICKKNVAIYALLRCKIFSLKIWVCKIFDKFHVCLNRARIVEYWLQAFLKNSCVPTWREQQDTARTLESRPTCSPPVWTTSQQSPISSYTYQSFPPYSTTWLWRMPIILMETLPRRSSLPTSSSNTFGWKFC